MKTIIVETVYVDKETREDDELLILNKLNYLLWRIKPKYERIAVLIVAEERRVIDIPHS